MAKLLARFGGDDQLAADYEAAVLSTIKERWGQVVEAAGTGMPREAFYCRWTSGFLESVATVLERMKRETMVPFLLGFRLDRPRDDRRGDVLESLLRTMADAEYTLPTSDLASPEVVSAAVTGILGADVAGFRIGGLMFCSRCTMFAAETFPACVCCGATGACWGVYRLAAVVSGGSAP